MFNQGISNDLFNMMLDNDIDGIKSLIEEGLDINSLTIGGSTLFKMALTLKNPALVELFLQNNANANLKNVFGSPILNDVIETENIELVKLLIEYGAEVNFERKMEIPPLHLAIIKKNLQIIQCLLDHGAEVNGKNKFGETPLHFAINNTIDIENITKLLIERGDDINIKDDKGLTPLEHAIENHNVQAIKILSQYEGILAISVDKTSRLSYTVSDLIEKGVNKKIIVKSILNSNSISDKVKSKTLFFHSSFTKDIHHEVIDDYLKVTIKKWQEKNRVDLESFNNNEYINVVKLYKKYKDIAINSYVRTGKFSEIIEDNSPASDSFAEEIERIFNKKLSFFVFKKLLSLNSNTSIIENGYIVLNNVKKNEETNQQLKVEYNIADQTIFPQWVSNNTSDKLLETDLIGDIN